MKHSRAMRAMIDRVQELQGESGQALIELATVLPVLLLLSTGVCAFGLTVNNYLMLVDGVNDGARQLVLSRSQTSDPCATISAYVVSGAPRLDPTKLSFTFILNGTPFTGRTCTSGAADLVQGQPAEVMATYPCSLAAYRYNFAPGCTLTAQTTELVQ
jgi:Flp pilus assembly protein TadG